MTLQTIPDAEALIGAHLRDHPDLEALNARVAGHAPADGATSPWIRLTLLDAQNDAQSIPEHLIDYMLQLDCYASAGAMRDHVGQAEANRVALAARAVLHSMPQEFTGDAVITSARFVSMARIPDEGYEPARERVILTATIFLHARP